VPLLNEQDASDLQKIPVKELKAACQELDLPCDGRKKDLITRLIMFAESQGISASQLQLSQTQENDHEPARVEPSAHPIEVAVKTALPGTAQPAEVENPTIEESCMGAAMAVVPPAKTRAAGVLGQDLSSLSARDLRNACAEHGLPTGGSKKALLERLTPMLSPGAEAEAPSRKAFTQEVAVTAPPVGPQTAGSLVQDLTSLSTRELRIACTEHGLLTGGSKMVLVERLTAMVMAPIDERPPSLVNRSSSVPASQPDASAQSPSRLPSLWVPPTRSPLREETRADTQDIVSTPSAQAGLQLQACRYSPESEQVALGAKSAQDIVTTVARELSLLPRHELREACLRVGIPAQGSKAELVDRLAALAATDAPLGEEEVLQAPRPTDSPEAPPINTDGFEESQDIPASLQGLSLEALQAACRACGLSTSGDEAALTTRLALLMSQPETAEMVKPLDPDPSIVQSVDQRLGYGFDEPLSHGPYHTDVSAAQPAAESCTSSSLMACAGMQQMKGCLSLARNSELSGSSGLQGDVAQQSCCDSADPRSGICIDAARSAPKPNARGAKPPTSASGGLIAAPAETSCVAESIPIEALPPPAIESDSHWAAVASREGASLESSIPLGQPDPSAEQALVGKQLGVELAQGIRGGGSKVTAASGGVFTGELGRRKDVTPPLHQAAPAARNTLGNAVISAPVPVATADSASATGLLMLRSIELRRLCRERGLEATGSKEDLAVRILTLAQTGDATPSEQEACTPTPERQRAPAAPAKLPQRQEVSGTPQARVDVALASLPPEVLQRHASEATTQPIVLQSAAAAGVVVAAVAEHIPAVAAQKRPGHHLWLAPESPVQTRTESTDKTPSQPLAPTNLWVEPLHEHAMAVGDEVSLLKRPRTSLVAGPQGDIAPEPSAVPKLSTLWQTMSTFKITKSAFAGGVQSHALGDAEPGAACRDAMGNARGRANPSSKTRSVLPPPGWLLGALPTQAEAHLTNVSGQVCGRSAHAARSDGSKGSSRVVVPKSHVSSKRASATGTCHGQTGAGAPCRCVGSVRPRGARYTYCRKHASKWARFETVGVEQLPVVPEHWAPAVTQRISAVVGRAEAPSSAQSRKRATLLEKRTIAMAHGDGPHAKRLRIASIEASAYGTRRSPRLQQGAREKHGCRKMSGLGETVADGSQHSDTHRDLGLHSRIVAGSDCLLPQQPVRSAVAHKSQLPARSSCIPAVVDDSMLLPRTGCDVAAESSLLAPRSARTSLAAKAPLRAGVAAPKSLADVLQLLPQ